MEEEKVDVAAPAEAAPETEADSVEESSDTKPEEVVEVTVEAPAE